MKPVAPVTKYAMMAPPWVTRAAAYRRVVDYTGAREVNRARTFSMIALTPRPRIRLGRSWSDCASRRNTMLKKAKEAAAQGNATSGSKDLAQAVLDSSHQIWLAGVGAFVRARQEGGKAFESLVQQGEKLEQRT